MKKKIEAWLLLDKDGKPVTGGYYLTIDINIKNPGITANGEKLVKCEIFYEE